MSLRINDTAPDFEAETTQGRIRFHAWIGDQWAVLFSHPKDFTPVCTTELGYMAKIEPEFTRRNAQLIGLSADPVGRHEEWSRDIEETQGAKVKYPMIGDADLKVAKLYNMLPADEVGADGRTAANNATVPFSATRHSSTTSDGTSKSVSSTFPRNTNGFVCVSRWQKFAYASGKNVVSLHRARVLERHELHRLALLRLDHLARHPPADHRHRLPGVRGEIAALHDVERSHSRS